MAKWLVPCLGGCGKTLKRGSNALPAPICRACRRRRRVLICDYCNMPFRSSGGHLDRRFCSISHSNRYRGLMSLDEAVSA